MSPKLFWIRVKNNYLVFTTDFRILKNVWSCPKQFGPTQKRFGPIEGHVRSIFNASTWLGSNLKIDTPIFNLSPFSHYNISLFLNRKSWVPGPIPGRKCTGLLSTEFRLCVYQEDPSQHHHYFQARNIHIWRQIILGYFWPTYISSTSSEDFFALVISWLFTKYVDKLIFLYYLPTSSCQYPKEVFIFFLALLPRVHSQTTFTRRGL